MSRILPVTARSGQKRINAKRTNRAHYWTEERRTVQVLCSNEIEPYFRGHLHLLGERARIDGRRALANGFEILLDVHVPGAPAQAVRAIPVYYSDWDGVGQATARLESVEWYDSHGQLIAEE